MAVVEILFLAPREDVPPAIGSITPHHLMEVHTLISWYQVDIEHKAFIKDTVWGQSIRCFAELCLVQRAKYRNAQAQARASARGAHEPTTKYNNEMQPLASTHQKRWDAPILPRFHQGTYGSQRTLILIHSFIQQSTVNRPPAQ
eukprot:scaffold2507_cov122-Isochrysis_galbana.AAC.8